MNKISPYAAGTTLYVPAIARKFMRNILEEKYPFLPSITLCLEDAIRREEIPEGIECIKHFLREFAQLANAPLAFVRPPDPAVLGNLLDLDLTGLTGFVLPKFSPRNFENWQNALGGSDFLVMPTLETPETFDVFAMREMRVMLQSTPLGKNVVLLRIGGNDLQQILGIARKPSFTVYDGALGHTLGMLANVFIPAGLALAAPVFNIIDAANPLLERELALDIQHGFCGKTAVHPAQLAAIRAAYAVDESEIKLAKAIFADGQPVFRYDNMMCEPVVQSHWAANILERQRIFGIRSNRR